MDFASWVMDPATFKSSQSGVGPHVGQHKYLLHKDEIKVDFLGRFENLQNDFSKLCLNLNISYPPLPHLNKSSHRQYSSYYNKECREAVHDRFIKDIEYFDYKFQEK